MSKPVGPLRVAVIGAGMAGVLAAIRATERGDEVVVFEKADRLGGTWRENTYPGIACDVPSHFYTYSFAPNPDWSALFAPGDEICAYFERVAKEHGVMDLIRFGEEVTEAVWTDGEWELCTSTGARETFDVVLAATGVLHHPKVPDLPGLDDFEGTWFHSARWDHSIDDRLADLRVGVVGNGSSGVQIVTDLAGRVAHLDLFQRTPQWIMAMANTPYSPEQRAEFAADLQKCRAEYEMWNQTFTGNFSNAVVEADSPEIAFIEQMCLDNLEKNVADPDLRERLRPDHRAACKRLVLSAGFYDAVQRPDSDLVTSGIERIEPTGVRTTDGELHELDVLVLATGFRVDRFVRPMTVRGRGGRSLDDIWADRPIAYFSMTVPEMPNFFLLNGPNGPVGNFSLVLVAELQMAYLDQLLERLRSGEATAVEPTWDATNAHESERVEAAGNTIWVTGCRSWYLDDRGIPAAWPWTFDRFRSEMDGPNLDAFTLT